MNELSEYHEFIIDNIDNLLQEMKVACNDYITIYDTASIELDALSESVNTCNDSTCAEELNVTLTIWKSNLSSTSFAQSMIITKLDNEVNNMLNISSFVDNVKIEKLKEKAADCLSL